MYQLTARYRDAQPVICDSVPGRRISAYDLLDDVEDTYGLDRREAHKAIHAALQQLIDADGEDQVIIDRRPQRPELLRSNPRNVDVRYWLVVRAESVDEIRKALEAAFGDC